MLLKRLELLGFKSFADKTAIDFGPGITAIVGPNGSGKSNIVDAIRWVLGEGSARALRGGRMEDVIFGGSAARRALPMAEVTLTVDNEDGLLPIAASEVAVARHIDRASTSEYLLGGTACRLRDIQDLFFGTGLGKAAYAVIGQGEVDALLVARPEERRLAIEEAAGVTRYRARRAEAARRLGNAEANLRRLNDILAERRRALGPLERQAEQARRHASVAAELRSLELALWARELADGDARLDQARRSADTARRRTAELVAERDAAAREREAAASRLAAVREERSLARDAAARVAEALGRARQEAALAQGLAQGLAQEAERLTAQLHAAEGRLAGWDEQAAREAERQQALLAERAEAAAEMAAAEAELAAAGTRRAAASSSVGRLRGDLAAVRAERRQLSGGAAAAEVAAAQAEAEAAAAARAAAEAAAGAARERLSGLRAHRGELREALQASRSRAAALRETAGAGYAAGPRNALAWKLPGIVGALADLLEVPRELRTAVDAALGASAQYLVATQAALAEAAIGELKRRQGGRATFLPLDALRTGPPPPGGYDKRPGALGWASDLVRCAEQVRPAVLHVLGRVLVAHDLAAARRLARESGLRLRVVTLEGDVVHPGGAMSGGAGSGRQGPSLVGRAAEMKALVRRSEAIEADLALIDAVLATAQRALEAADADAAASGRRQAAAEALARRRPIEAGREADLAAREARLQSDLRAAEEALREAEAGETAARRRQTAAQGRGAAVEGAVRGGGEWRERLEAERAAVEASRAELRAALERATAERGARVAEEAAAQAEAERLSSETAALQAAERERAGAEGEAERALQAIDAHRSEAEAGRSRLEDELRRCEVEEARLDAAQAALAERLLDAYGLELEALRAIEPAERPAAARARAADLRRELAEIGSVSSDAPDAFAQASREVRLLAERLDDVEAARELVLRWCERLDASLERRYEETLAQVRAHFRLTFERLFGGGRADLAPTEQGLEIVAQPPGKQLGSLSLLSGGERVLVAIALLFALLSVRPAAFCVLDEIEAALDDTNVGRFAAFLSDLSATTQFLVITHQKGTMEVADRLVGVTMVGAGVSSLVSVRLAG